MRKAVGYVAAGLLAIGVCSGCITQPAQTAAPGTTSPPGTVFPSGIDTIPNRPPLVAQRPEEVRDVKSSELPVALRINLALLGLSEEDGRCINTSLSDYLSGPGAVFAIDDERTVAALGGAILVCTDQDRLAGFISATVRGSKPNITDQQTDCIREEIEVADPAALAVFLGAFTYANGGMEKLQQPFIASFERACGLT